MSDFGPMWGPAQIFVHFSQTVFIGSIWGWGGRGRPLPNILAHWRSKKVVQVVQIRGRGGEGVKVIWTKSKRTATSFFGKPSLSQSVPYVGIELLWQPITKS